MRYAYFIACFNLFLLQLVSARPLPRVGDTIDVAERAYFQLFPTISEYCEALLSTDDWGDVIDIRSRNPRQNVIVHIDQTKRAELAHYLNVYESIECGKQNVNRALLSDFIRYTPHRTKKGTMIEIGKSDGAVARGRLFNVSDSIVTVVYPHIVPDWNDSTTFQSLAADQIDYIKKRGIGRLKGSRAGFLSGVTAFTIFAFYAHADQGVGAAIAIPLVGTVSGICGALIGLTVTEFYPKQVFAVRRSAENLARYKARLERHARSPYLPPELSCRKPTNN